MVLKRKKNWGGGGEGPPNFFFKNVPGVLKHGGGGGDFGVFGEPHAPTRGSCGVGKHFFYDHDPILERFGLAVKSYHLETLAVEEAKKKNLFFLQNHKAFPSGNA